MRKGSSRLPRYATQFLKSRDKLKPNHLEHEKGWQLTARNSSEPKPSARHVPAHVKFFAPMMGFCYNPIVSCPVNNPTNRCNGTKFDTYVDWLAIVSAITNVCCPAISIPAGFTRENLPVGIQIVAPPRGEARLLAGAKMLEDILGFGAITPIDPVSPTA